MYLSHTQASGLTRNQAEKIKRMVSNVLCAVRVSRIMAVSGIGRILAAGPVSLAFFARSVVQDDDKAQMQGH
jgi:hypothetical protein